MATPTEQDILSQEARLLEAVRTLDLPALDRFYAADLLLTGVMGEPTCSKNAVMDEAKRGIAERDGARAAGHSIEMSAQNEDMQVVTHGDTAIASYRFVVTVKGPNLDLRRRYRKTNVWMKRDERWQIVAAHTAFVLDPKQAAMLSGEVRE